MPHEVPCNDPIPNLPPNLPTDRRALLAGIGGLAAGAFIAGKANAGPLSPPAGPVASTGKTLSEVEPRIAINSTNTPGDADSVYRIGQSGSYYLSGNVVVGPGKRGIKIAASGVTIDLNGFQLGAFGGTEGIVASSTALERVTIRNGYVALFLSGIVLPDTPGVLLENVIVEGCVSGPGIVLSQNARVINCISRSNQGFGIVVGSGSVVSGSVAADNAAIGIYTTGNGCVISGCAARANGGNGIDVASSCTVIGCIAQSNESSGFRLGNTATIINCSAETNGGNGIFGSFNSSIIDCTVFANSSNGISVERACLIRGNSCIDNGTDTAGSGIRVFNDECRVEGNNCIRNYRGIYVTGSGNIIIANTCSNSASVNWQVDAGNKCLVVAGVNAAAISGNSGGASPGSTNPFANFTF